MYAFGGGPAVVNTLTTRWQIRALILFKMDSMCSATSQAIIYYYIVAKLNRKIEEMADTANIVYNVLPYSKLCSLDI